VATRGRSRTRRCTSRAKEKGLRGTAPEPLGHVLKRLTDGARFGTIFEPVGRRAFLVKRLAILFGVLVASAAIVGDAGSGTIRSQYVVVLEQGTDRDAAVKRARALGGDVFMQYSHALNGYAVTLPEAALARLKADSRVLLVAPNEEFQASWDPTTLASRGAASGGTCPLNTTSGFATQCLPPGIDRVDGERSSARSGDGRGAVNVNVAVVDTGIDATHPDLNVAGGTNCTNDGYGLTDPGHHGTFVGGIVAAKDNDYGVVGVAPGARLWAVRVLNKNGSGTTAMVVCGIDWVTGTRSDSDPSNDIAVANMSLGAKGTDDGNCGRTKKDAIHLAICNSVAAGVAYVVSAGNSALDIQSQIPAGYDEVLTMSAMADFDGRPGGRDSAACSNTDDAAATFSNFATLSADQMHVAAAPGVCVVSTFPVGVFPETNYAIWSGTSFSSPHGAGLVALCIASGPCAGLTPAQITRKVVADAAAYNAANPGYGFQGDPSRPLDGKYYGYLIRAGLY
jgi:subtilisin